VTVQSSKDVKFGDIIKSLISKYLKEFCCCTVKDIFYLARNSGYELKLEHIRYYLESLEAHGNIKRTKIARKNVYYLTKSEEHIRFTLRQIEDQIVTMLSKGLLFHTAEIINEIERVFKVGRGVIHLILQQLAFKGEISYFFGLSYNGKKFRLYFLTENKKELEKQIIRVKNYVLFKRLVFPNEKAVEELVFFDENGVWKDLKMIHLDVQDFKNILFYLSYLGEVNQIYFVQGYPFAVPGHASQLESLLKKINSNLEDNK
jgi:hypothetical protein